MCEFSSVRHIYNVLAIITVYGPSFVVKCVVCVACVNCIIKCPIQCCDTRSNNIKRNNRTSHFLLTQWLILTNECHTRTNEINLLVQTRKLFPYCFTNILIISGCVLYQETGKKYFKVAMFNKN